MREEVLQILGAMTNVIRVMTALTEPELVEYERVPTERVMEGVGAMYPGFQRYIKYEMERNGQEYQGDEFSMADLAEIFMRGQLIVDNGDGTCQVTKLMLRRFEFAEDGGDDNYDPEKEHGPPPGFDFKSRG